LFPIRTVFVIPGLVPGIHLLLSYGTKGVDGRVKPGHDDDDGVRRGPCFLHIASQLM